MKQYLKAFFLLSILITCSNSIATAANDDPCQEIVGDWSGKGYNSQLPNCEWTITATGAMYKDTVLLQAESIGNKQECRNSHPVFTGTCKDAKVELTSNGYQLQGTVFSNFLHLSNNVSDLQLKKITK